MIVTRFAPSPTGDPHIGNIRTALFAWAFARSKEGLFFVRIEDTDKSREKPGSIEAILKSLAWLEMDYDFFETKKVEIGGKTIKYKPNKKYKGVLFQSENLDIYKSYALDLVQKGKAYICTCSAERLKTVREKQVKSKKPPMYDGICRNSGYSLKNINEPFVIRLKVPSQGVAEFDDIIRGKLAFLYNLIDDQVLLKSDGYPTYHLANVVDDHLMGVSHIIRGEDWLPSTPKHILLYEYFGWEKPAFAHLPLILGNDKKRLSKRHGAVSVLEYTKLGYLSSAILNYLALLGWNPGTEQEFFTKEEITRIFSLKRVQKSPAIFDLEKLDWVDGHYIRSVKSEKLLEKIKKYGSIFDNTITEFITGFESKRKGMALGSVKLVRDRMNTLQDYLPLTLFLCNLPDYDASLLSFKNNDAAKIKSRLNQLLLFLDGLKNKNFTEEILERECKSFIDKNGFSAGEVLHPMRIALTGLQNSPGPFETAAVLGKDESLARIRGAIEKLN